MSQNAPRVLAPLTAALCKLHTWVRLSWGFCRTSLPACEPASKEEPDPPSCRQWIIHCKSVGQTNKEEKHMRQFLTSVNIAVELFHHVALRPTGCHVTLLYTIFHDLLWVRKLSTVRNQYTLLTAVKMKGKIVHWLPQRNQGFSHYLLPLYSHFPL